MTPMVPPGMATTLIQYSREAWGMPLALHLRSTVRDRKKIIRRDMGVPRRMISSFDIRQRSSRPYTAVSLSMSRAVTPRVQASL